jgi:hypothetical protein
MLNCIHHAALDQPAHVIGSLNKHQLDTYHLSLNLKAGIARSYKYAFTEISPIHHVSQAHNDVVYKDPPPQPEPTSSRAEHTSDIRSTYSTHLNIFIDRLYVERRHCSICSDFDFFRYARYALTMDGKAKRKEPLMMVGIAPVWSP